MITRKIKIQRKEVRRYGVHISLTQERSAVIGSYLTKTGAVGTGLTFDEIKEYLPSIIGVEATDAKFRTEVNRYFSNMIIPIPYEGREFDVTLDPETNRPVNTEDYIRYKFALSHPRVADSKTEAESSQHKDYYVEDLEVEMVKKTNRLRNKTEATIKFASLIQDEVKLDYVGRELSVKYPKEIGSLTSFVNLKPSEKQLKVAEVMDTDPNYFASIVDDEDLVYKAQIASLVESKIVQKIGNEFVYGSEPLGDLNATIAFMKNPNNSETYTVMLARLNQFGIGFKDKAKPTAKVKKD